GPGERQASNRPTGLSRSNPATAGAKRLSAVSGRRDDDGGACEVGHPAVDIGSEEVDREPRRRRGIDVAMNPKLIGGSLRWLGAGRPRDERGARHLGGGKPTVLGRLRIP